MDQWQVIESLRDTKTQELDMVEIDTIEFPKRYLEIASHIGVQQIASDFILPPSMHLAVENLRVTARSPGWRVFAVSTSSDMWLMRVAEDEDLVAFLPQDEHGVALPEPLGITLYQWFELALYMKKYEAAVTAARGEPEKRTLKTKAKAFMESLAKGLTQRYPYSL